MISVLLRSRPGSRRVSRLESIRAITFSGCGVSRSSSSSCSPKQPALAGLRAQRETRQSRAGIVAAPCSCFFFCFSLTQFRAALELLEPCVRALRPAIGMARSRQKRSPRRLLELSRRELSRFPRGIVRCVPRFIASVSLAYLFRVQSLPP